MEPEHDIAAPDFAEKFPELHHYTDFGGLRGIVTTNTLWATHFARLNDRSEMQALRQPMIDILSTEVTNILRTEFLNNRHQRRSFEKNFNVAGETKIFVNAVFDTAFGSGPPEPLAEAYVTSFCAHTETSYEAENGLLSQWRAYGVPDARYCIVFDSAKILRLLEKERDQYYWVYLKIVELKYDTGETDIASLFPDLVELYKQYLVDRITRGLGDFSRQMIAEFLAAATRFKHQGFREEREVRVVAIPHKQSIAEAIRSQSATDDNRQVKIVHPKLVGRGGVPPLVLFDTFNLTLPIKRIIVGPSGNQDENVARTRSLVRKGASVCRSDTPFIG